MIRKSSNTNYETKPMPLRDIETRSAEKPGNTRKPERVVTPKK